MSDTDHSTDDLYWRDLLFAVRRSIRYNMRRRAHFEFWHRATSAAGVFFGSATVVGLLQGTNPVYFAATGAIVTVLFAIDLVVGNARRAWLHADIERQFIQLEMDMLTGQQSAATLKKHKKTRLTIEQEEPPVLYVLSIICHNDLIKAGHYEDNLYKIDPFQNAMANFFDWQDHKIEADPSVKQKIQTATTEQSTTTA